MWRDEKIDYLRKNRDYGSLLEGDAPEIQTPRGQSRGKTKESDYGVEEEFVSQERQEYLDRRKRLRDLERQKLTGGRGGAHINGAKQRQEAEHQSRVNARGLLSKRGDAGQDGTTEKKKLPYDRSFGSFFGPSEPVVAKRIIEEGRAREEVHIAAARQAKAKEEAARKRSVAVPKSGKPNNVKPSGRVPSKPVVETTDKIRQLKAARDYSFLFDEASSGLTELDPVRKASAALAQGGHSKINGIARQANTPTSRNFPIAAQKSSSIGQNTGKPRPPLRPSETTLKSGQHIRNPFKEPSRDRFAADRKPQNWEKAATSSTPSSGRASGPAVGRTDLKKDDYISSQAATGRNGVGVPKLNGNKIVSHSSLSKQVLKLAVGQRGVGLERTQSEILEKRLSQSADRLQSSTSNGRVANQSTVRRIVESAERRPPPSIDRRPAPPTNRLSTQSLDRRPLQSTDRRPPQASSNRPPGGTEARLAPSAERRPIQVKERPPVVARPAERQSAASRLPSQGTTIRAPNGASLKQRAPILEKRKAAQSMDARRGPLKSDARMRRNGYGYSSEDDNDSFIDDDDAPQDVSSLIHSIMGYNPNKYRANDDFDDRDMVAGFRAIEAEERRSAREGRREDEREAILIEAEEREERLRKAKKKRKQGDR